MTDQPHGLARGLTNYGDSDFSLGLAPGDFHTLGEGTVNRAA